MQSMIPFYLMSKRLVWRIKRSLPTILLTLLPAWRPLLLRPLVWPRLSASFWPQKATLSLSDRQACGITYTPLDPPT